MNLRLILFVCFVIVVSAPKPTKKTINVKTTTTTTTTTTEEPTSVETTPAAEDNPTQETAQSTSESNEQANINTNSNEESAATITTALEDTQSSETTQITTEANDQEQNKLSTTLNEDVSVESTTGASAEASTELSSESATAITEASEVLTVSTSEPIATTTTINTIATDSDEESTTTTENAKKREKELADIKSANQTMAKLSKDMEKESKSFFGKFGSGFGSGFNKFSNMFKPSSKDSSFYAVYNKMLQSMYLASFKMAAAQQKTNKAGSKSGSSKKPSEESENFWASVPIFKNMLGNTCFPDIGCFSAGEYLSFSKRPLPLLPMAPEFINMTFHLYTVDSKTVPKNFTYKPTDTQLKNSKFNPKLKTIIITHGFRSGFEDWMIALKDYLFRETSEYNIVCAVWEKGSKVPMYQLAASNTRVVGALIAFFATTIVKTYQYSNDKFYLIGHSLGGHVVGYAGKRLQNPKVSRITGLDPAGPGFISYNNSKMYLSIDDATMVDAIHTDVGQTFSEGLGTDKDFGYYNFYPNGGFFQPGCKPSRGVYNIIYAIATGDEISCSHTRAFRFAAIGSKHNECQPIAYQCQNQTIFLEGRCADCSDRKCMPMGLNPDFWLSHNQLIPDIKTSKYKYFIQTAPIEDFCLYHYQIALHAAKGTEPSTGQYIRLDDRVKRGYFEFNIKSTFKGGLKEAKFMRIVNQINPNRIYTTLVTFDYKLENIEHMSITWKQYNLNIEKKRVNKGSEIKIPFVEFNYMSHFEKSVRDENTKIFCPKNALIISPNSKKHEFIECKPENKASLKQRANSLPSKYLFPLTIRQDIKSVDHLSAVDLVHKIEDSNFQNKSIGIKSYIGG